MKVSLVRVLTCAACLCMKEGLGLSCHMTLLHLLPCGDPSAGELGATVPLVELSAASWSHMQGVG